MAISSIYQCLMAINKIQSGHMYIKLKLMANSCGKIEL
jgi:hypothetical protein